MRDARGTYQNVPNVIKVMFGTRTCGRETQKRAQGHGKEVGAGNQAPETADRKDGTGLRKPGTETVTRSEAQDEGQGAGWRHKAHNCAP